MTTNNESNYPIEYELFEEEGCDDELLDGLIDDCIDLDTDDCIEVDPRMINIFKRNIEKFQTDEYNIVIDINPNDEDDVALLKKMK